MSIIDIERYSIVGAVREDKAAAHAMVKDIGIRFLSTLGLSSDEANSFFYSESWALGGKAMLEALPLASA